MDVRDYIKPAIEKSGLKQFVVAERMGLTPQQLTDIIGKRRRFEANELVTFCQVVDIAPNELIERSTYCKQKTQS